MAGDPTLEERIDALYRGPAEEFIAARDALAKELRAAKDKDGAATVKALRKPTVAAWAVNQVAHAEPSEVRKLQDVGDELRAAHEALLEGDGDAGVRQATAKRRQVVGDLTDRAVAALGASGEAQREAISHTFDAAVADPEAAEAVLAGRLTKELEAPSGFGGGLVFPDSSPAVRRRPTPTRPAKRKPSGKAGHDDDEETAAAAEAAAEAERQAEAQRRAEHLSRLEQELAERKAEADEATRLADEAHDEVERLQAELDAAEVRARDADTGARRARKAAELAQRELDRAAPAED